MYVGIIVGNPAKKVKDYGARVAALLEWRTLAHAGQLLSNAFGNDI
jgi:hypothetical protein